MDLEAPFRDKILNVGIDLYHGKNLPCVDDIAKVATFKIVHIDSYFDVAILKNLDVLFITKCSEIKDKTFTNSEILLVKDFVQNGGTLVCADQAWSWVYPAYDNRSIESFPLNVLGKSLGFWITGENIGAPTLLDESLFPGIDIIQHSSKWWPSRIQFASSNSAAFIRDKEKRVVAGRLTLGRGQIVVIGHGELLNENVDLTRKFIFLGPKVAPVPTRHFCVNLLRKVWADPVWSKVISAGIIVAIGGSWAWFSKQHKTIEAAMRVPPIAVEIKNSSLKPIAARITPGPPSPIQARNKKVNTKTGWSQKVSSGVPSATPESKLLSSKQPSPKIENTMHLEQPCSGFNSFDRSTLQEYVKRHLSGHDLGVIFISAGYRRTTKDDDGTTIEVVIASSRNQFSKDINCRNPCYFNQKEFVDDTAIEIAKQILLTSQ